MSLRTYRKIQKFNLAPAVNGCWENEQRPLLKLLQGKSKGLVEIIGVIPLGIEPSLVPII